MRVSTFTIVFSLLVGAVFGVLLAQQEIPGLLFVGVLAFALILLRLIQAWEA